MSRFADGCLPFFKLLNKIRNFKWMEDCQRAFDELKKYLKSPSLLACLKPGEEL